MSHKNIKSIARLAFICSLSQCKHFNESFVLPKSIEFVLIDCHSSDKKKAKSVYTNAHAIVRRKPLKSSKASPAEAPLSVLMLGIDSISRLNLQRAMPKTNQLLQKTGWFELNGYNKVTISS